MKKSQLKQIIQEEISKVLREEKMKGRLWEDDNYYTYDHLLPKGTGDDFTTTQGKMMMKAAKEDLKELKSNNKNGVIKKDNMNLPYLQIIQEEIKSLKEGKYKAVLYGTMPGASQSEIVDIQKGFEDEESAWEWVKKQKSDGWDVIPESVKSLKEGGWGEANVEAQQIFDLILDELDGISPGVTLNIKITDIGDLLYITKNAFSFSKIFNITRDPNSFIN